MASSSAQHGTSPELVRHGRLVARGAPPALASLHGDWERSVTEPVFGGRLHVTRWCGEGDGRFEAHLYYAEGGWCVSTAAAAGDQVLLIYARSDSLAPSTVRPDEHLRSGGGTAPLPKFAIEPDGPVTKEDPFLMDELGFDVFVRGPKRIGRVCQIWWLVDPATNHVYPSAAKPSVTGGRPEPGKRFCHICKKCFSANHFTYQHMLMHLPRQVDGLRMGQAPNGAVHLDWSPSADGGLLVTHWALSRSLDGDGTWGEVESRLESRAIVAMPPG